MLEALELPVRLATPGSTMTVRRAVEDDLNAIMRLLSDDPVSAARGDVADDSDEPHYRRALAAILADPGNDLVVVVDDSATVIGTLQLTAIPGMARRGSARLLVEAVRVDSSRRSGGVGGGLMTWVVDVAAPSLGCSIVQLTSDRAREDAHRFYERLGFVPSHTGFKYAVRAADEARSDLTDGADTQR
ncbi:MAG: GNAT family N-acetyltransferase [Aeromicrobium sp.]